MNIDEKKVTFYVIQSMKDENPGMPGTKAFEDYCRKKLRPVIVIGYFVLFVSLFIYAIILVLFSKIKYVGEIIAAVFIYIIAKGEIKVFNKVLGDYEKKLRKKHNIPDYIDY